jgi:hypothetical protein
MDDVQVPVAAGTDWTAWVQDIVGSAAKGYIKHEFGGNNQPLMVDPATGQVFTPGQVTHPPQQSILPAVGGKNGMLMMAMAAVVVYLLVK